MPKNWIFALFLAIFAIAVVGIPQAASAQDKPIPDAKEKAKECDEEDDEDEDDLTEADRASIKVTFADARKIALARVAGKITDQELEKENGRIRYEFEIVTADGKSFEVVIDAVTGEVLKVEDEDADDDDDEVAVKSVVKVVDRTVVVTKKPQ